MATIVGTFENEVLNGTPEADLIQAEPAGRTVIPDHFVPGFGDTLNGGAGDDTLVGGGGEDRIDGGDGIDTLILTSDQPGGVMVLLGEDVDGRPWVGGPEGQGLTDNSWPNGVDQLFSIENIIGTPFDDEMVGGAGANRLEGGGGNDFVSGVGGDDTVLGGAGSDVVHGGDGADVLNGNMGDDTCNGGAGDDIVRGGQGADSLAGGAGADFMSGDRGDDTMTGGAGADIFHSSADAGIDRVLDFSVADGDRVLLDPGTAFTVTQEGADTVIHLSAGEVILMGVQMASLPPGSILLG